MIRFTRSNDFEDLSTAADLSAAVAASSHGPVVLFKHSEMCGSSYRAQREVKKLAGEFKVFRLVVQRSREVSRIIEEALAIRHETPQIILLFRGKAVFNASHSRVKAERIRREIQVLLSEHER